MTAETLVERLSYGATTRIVLIGTSRCPKDETNLPSLPHVRNNIDELARIFGDPDIIGLSESETASVIRIMDEPEASAILDKIATQAQEATDTLLVYYAGHGLYGDAQVPLYLTSGNTTSTGKAFNGIPITKIREAIAGSLASKRVLILDCCYGGRAFEGMGGKDAAAISIDISGTYGIAAVPGSAKALAPPGERYTLFTKQLIDILNHGIEGAQDILTLGEIFDELRVRIDREAKFPVPEALNWKDGKSFRFARNRFFKFDDATLSDTLDGLRKTVAQLGARLEGIEVTLSERQTYRNWLHPFLVKVPRKTVIKCCLVLSGIPIYAIAERMASRMRADLPYYEPASPLPYYEPASPLIYSVYNAIFQTLLLGALSGYIFCIVVSLMPSTWRHRITHDLLSRNELFWSALLGLVLFFNFNLELLAEALSRLP